MDHPEAATAGRRSTADRLRPQRANGGFTLIEVMVALVVMGVVLVGARAMLGQIADQGARIGAAAEDADREANADALLHEMAGRAFVSAVIDDEVRFDGQPGIARFRSWCEVPDGWLEPCDVSLGLIQVDSGNVLALTLSTGELVPLRRGFRSGEILYLGDAGAGGSWVKSWGASITAPLALGVVIDGDTTIVPIGERG